MEPIFEILNNLFVVNLKYILWTQNIEKHVKYKK